MLPTLALIRSGKTVDYVVGFQDLGGVDDFPTSVLEARLLVRDYHSGLGFRISAPWQQVSRRGARALLHIAERADSNVGLLSSGSCRVPVCNASSSARRRGRARPLPLHLAPAWRNSKLRLLVCCLQAAGLLHEAEAPPAPPQRRSVRKGGGANGARQQRTASDEDSDFSD